MIRQTLLTAAAVCALLPGDAVAAELAGRQSVDIENPPWDAVVKVQTSLAKKCTGVLVAPAVVLTAAHCLINHKTRRLLGPSSLHVLTGYDRGNFTGHYRVSGYTVPPAYDASAPQRSFAVDWAVLRLHSPVDGIAPMAVAATVPPEGTAVAVAGYYADRNQILLADTVCRTAGVLEVGGSRLIRHDCALTKGTSGGPLLTRRGAGWAVIGVNVADSGLGKLAVPVEALAAAIAQSEVMLADK